MTYKIGITSYDNDHELWETHIGSEDMELLFSVWGKTEKDSKKKAERLVKLLGQMFGHLDI